MRLRMILSATLLVVSGVALSAEAQGVSVDVNPNASKSIGDVGQLHRERFFNMHTSTHTNEFSAEEKAYLKKVNAGTGRIFMSPDAGSNTRRGTSVAELKKRAESWVKYSANIDINSSNFMEGIVITGHPTPGANADSPRKNYAFEWKGVGADYSDEAEFVVDYLQSFFVDYGLSLPSLFEPMNEPYVHAKDYARFGAKSEDVRVEMARYHKALAEKIQSRFGDKIKIGGFASAWPYMEGFDSDFQHWNERMKMFIDVAGEQMDFLSFHIYDGKNVTGEESFRSGSNAEALIDLIEGYTTIKFGAPKPIVISEHGLTYPGMSNKPYSEQSNWHILRSLNMQTMQFIQRSDNMIKNIPFISAKATWNKGPHPYPWVIMRKDESGNYVWTHLVKYFELWRDLKGDFIDSHSSHIDVQTIATIDEKSMYLVINNLEAASVDIEINVADIADNKLKKASIRRLYGDENKVPTLTDEKFDIKSSSITLRDGETVVITYEYQKPITPTEEVKSQRFYASSYLKPIKANEESSFEIAIKSGEIKRSTLKLAIARPHGMHLEPTLMVNGKSYKMPTNWKGYDQKSRTKEGFFGTIDIEIEPADLKENNIVSVTFNDDGGTVSTAALVIDYTK